MICVVVSAPNKPGKVIEAKAAIVKAAKYNKETHSGVVDAHALSNISGKAQRFHLVIYYESLAAYEEVRAKNDADAEWLEIRAQSIEAFTFSEAETTIYQVE